MANDVSAMGSASEVVDQNLDGFFMGKEVNPKAKNVRRTEQKKKRSSDTSEDMEVLQLKR